MFVKYNILLYELLYFYYLCDMMVLYKKKCKEDRIMIKVPQMFKDESFDTLVIDDDGVRYYVQYRGNKFTWMNLTDIRNYKIPENVQQYAVMYFLNKYGI